MKKGKWGVEKIISILKEADAGVPIAELSCKYGMSEATFYNWRKKSEGLEVNDAVQEKGSGQSAYLCINTMGGGSINWSS